MSWRSLILSAALASAWAEPIDTTANKSLWDELGLQKAEKTTYAGYTVSAWRFKDATGALAGSLEIPGARAVGNYALVCEGKCPGDLSLLSGQLPGLKSGSLPVLRTYLPTKNQAPHSARYVLGAVGLSQVLPEVPAAAVNFQFGAEAAVARYRAGKTQPVMAVFAYPTPQMARQQLPQLQKVPNAVVKRSGPLVGFVLGAPTEVAANQLLAEIEYQGSISWDQVPPLIIRPQTAAQIVLGGIKLSGYIIVFCLISGLAFGGFKALLRRIGHQDANESMIVLHLLDK